MNLIDLTFGWYGSKTNFIDFTGLMWKFVKTLWRGSITRLQPGFSCAMFVVFSACLHVNSRGVPHTISELILTYSSVLLEYSSNTGVFSFSNKINIFQHCVGTEGVKGHIPPFWQEEFEDTEGAIRNRISKKNRHHNGQKKKYTKRQTTIDKTYI